MAKLAHKKPIEQFVNRAAGESVLVLQLTVENYIDIGGSRVYLNGWNGRNCVSVAIVGPKTTKITRGDR